MLVTMGSPAVAVATRVSTEPQFTFTPAGKEMEAGSFAAEIVSEPWATSAPSWYKDRVTFPASVADTVAPTSIL